MPAEADLRAWLLTATDAAVIGLFGRVRQLESRRTAADIRIKALKERDELHYLKQRGLIEIESSEVSLWRARLTRYGYDLADYQPESHAPANHRFNQTLNRPQLIVSKRLSPNTPQHPAPSRLEFPKNPTYLSPYNGC